MRSRPTSPEGDSTSIETTCYTEPILTAFFLRRLKSLVLLLRRRSEHGVLPGFRYTEFQNGLRGNFDLLARRWIPADARFSFCFTSFPRPGIANSPFFASRY